MFPRLLVVILTLTALGAAVLGLRRERLATTHQIAICHEGINNARLNIRSQLPDLATHASPQAIELACDRAGMKLEPIAPAGQQPVPPPATPTGRTPGSGR